MRLLPLPVTPDAGPGRALSRRRAALSLALALAAAGALPLTAAEPVADASQMPRVQPTAATEASRTFAIRPGFRADLVAAEPLLESPVALALDESGAAFVVEMRDYSERRSEHLGRIRRLVDSDLDGRYDSASVLVDNLPWPTAVTCWDGGVFVGATPDIWYFKDTDGDGRADIRERIFTGFAEESGPLVPAKLNVQAMLNSFQWGPDQRIHGATSMSGGKVRRLDTPFVRDWLARAGVNPAAGEPTPLRGRDFAFDPRTLALTPTPGGGQHGMSLDATGRRFVCSNSDHLQQIVYDDAGIPQSGTPLPSTRASIAADGPAAPVFRRSPDEPWRVLRTRWRVSGLVEGLIEGGGRPSGYFTGATGVTAYRGDAYPAEMASDVFIADCGSNLIHRKRLRPDSDGIRLVGERVPDEAASEFLASSDNWFRPVQFVNAPDGCLWAIDMYRETIEHPWSIPEGLKRHLDLDSGRERGRLWRLAPTGLDATAATRRVRDLAGADTARLVSLLDHPNGWHRETAARLLHQQHAPTTPALLRASFKSTSSPLGRLHRLHVLAGLGALDAETVRAAFNDPDPHVRAAAVDRSFHATGPAPVPWTRLAADASPLVRLAMARHVSTAPSAERTETLAALVASGPELVRSLALAASAGSETTLWTRVRRSSPDALAPLARRIGRLQTDDDARRLLADIPSLAPRSRRFTVAAALAAGLADRNRPLRLVDADGLLAPIWADAHALATNPAASRTRVLGPSTGPNVDLNPDDPPARLAAIRLLAFDIEPDAIRVLAHRLAPGPDDIFDAALDGLARHRGPDWARRVSAQFPQVAPQRRARVFQLLVQRPEGRQAVVDALQAQWIKPTDLDAATIAALRRDPKVLEEVRGWIGEPAADRRAVIEKYFPTLNLKGNAAQGSRLFQERCASCHRLGNTGNALGPDLASVASNGPEKLLVAILDPNREVAPNFTAWRVATTDGDELSGLLSRDEPSGIVLRQAGATELSIPRPKLKSLENTGRSLMPEGLEDGLTPQQLADLLAHIAQPSP